MSDVLVTMSTLALAAGFAYLYYVDVNRQISGGGQQPIGTITFKRNEAERRFADRAVWQKVSESVPVYNSDSIRTLAESQAIIRLDDGTQISMGADTLITLNWSEGGKTVAFLGGSITAIRGGTRGAGAARGTTSGGSGASGMATATESGASSAAGLVITSGGSRVVVDDATVNLSQSAGRLDVSVASGQARVASAGQVQTVTTSQVARLDAATGAVKIAEQEISLDSPAPNSILIVHGAAAVVTFSCKSRQPSPAYRFEIANDPNFTRIARRVDSAAHSLSESLAPGVYYWRVTAGDAASTVEQLTVLADPRIVPQLPPADGVYSYNDTPPLVSFAWSPSSLTSSYNLEIASTADFTALVQSVPVSATRISLTTLPEGAYYWRVRPVYDYGESTDDAASLATAFRVIRNANLVAPVLIAPQVDASFTTLAVNSGGLLFNWQANPSIKSWTLLCATDREFTRAATRMTTTDNFLLVRSMLAPGTYYWQLRGVDAAGTETPASEVRSFSIHEQSATIRAESPRPAFVYDGSTFGNVPVVWTSDIRGTFQVELSTNAAFSTLFRQVKTTFNNSSFGTLPPGTYFWRVLLLAADGGTLLSSGTSTFTVMPPLVAPVAVVPAGGAALELINAPSISFRWDGDPRTEYYDFALYRADGGGQSVITRADNLTVNEFTIKELGALSVGDYTWELRAHNPASANVAAQASPPTLASFSISRLRIIPAPVLLSPALHDEIDGLGALNEGVGFSWQSPDPAGSALVEVASDSSFTQNLSQLPARAGTLRVSLPELLPGTYYWRVKARTSDGLDAPPSAVCQFAVLPLPPLAQPIRLTPSAGAVVDMWEKRALSFSWSSVPGATSYSISLLDPVQKRTIFSATDLKTTSYDYDELRTLDEHGFVWSIQAFQADRNGRLVRQSAALSTEFAITLGKKIGPTNITSSGRVFVQ